MTVKSSLVVTSTDARLLELWPNDADSQSMASGLCLLTSNNVDVVNTASATALLAANLYHYALRMDSLTAMVKLNDKNVVDNAQVEQSSMMQWNDSVSNAFALLRMRAERGHGAMDWFHVYHEKLSVAFEIDTTRHSVVAVISRSRPGLRAALRAAGIVFAMPCAPEIDVSERKSEILRQQLSLNGGEVPASGDDAEATRVAHIKEAIQLQSVSNTNTAAVPDVAAALAGTVTNGDEPTVSTALVVEGGDAVARLLQFIVALPRDAEAQMRAPAPFLRCSLQSALVERCSVVQLGGGLSSPRRSPRRRRSLHTSLEALLPVDATLSSPVKSGGKSPPRSPHTKQHYRLMVRGPLCAIAVERLLGVVAANTSNFVAQMQIENRSGGFNAWRGRDEAVQHAFVRSVSMDTDRQWRVTVEDAASVD
jgi:hypothetical protein